MEPNNPIFEYLQGLARLELNEQQRAYYAQRLQDARTVKCVRMRDAFTPEQLQFLFKNTGYKTQQKMCYRNAAELVERAEWMATHFDSGIPEIKYVEGLVYSNDLFPIDHAFVKIGDQYIDPTFERALKRDPRKEFYVSLIELDPLTMAQYQAETGYYGELYRYSYFKRFRPDLAERMRDLNPNR